MSDLKLFRVTDQGVAELAAGPVALERSLQQLIERNMETIFGVRFVASEHSTGAKHGGRIDSLGLDENGSPVIFEYKRAVNENVINQGLFYLDWLVDHRGDFELLVLRRFGTDTAASIDWRSPRLVCVARDFTKYDEHAVQQMGRTIDLVRYSDFEGELLALELVASTAAVGIRTYNEPAEAAPNRGVRRERTVVDLLGQADETLRGLYERLDAHLVALGDDVTMRTQKNYFAYRRLRNFACVEVHPQTRTLLIYLKVDPDTVVAESDFTRDMRSIGHFGTGDLEVRITTASGLERALPLVQRSYDAS